jgi:predicted PurR-regulated permease PerM
MEADGCSNPASAMHIVIWIFTLLGWAVWSLLAWGLHALLTIDPQWIDDTEALIRNVPYAGVIDRWIPGWQELLHAAMDLTQTVLGWIGELDACFSAAAGAKLASKLLRASV